MKQLTDQEASELLSKLIYLRKMYNATGDESIHKKYKKHEEFCGQKFEYIIVSKLQKYRAFANYDDLKQDARIALLLALRNFDPKKGSFFWWANQYVGTKIKREANRHSSFHIPLKHAKELQPHKESFDPICYNRSTASFVLANEIEKQISLFVDSPLNGLQAIETNEVRMLVKNAMEKLPEEQRKIIELNGIKSYSINKISKELKLTRTDCVNLLNKAKENLKQSLQNINAA
jgi:RNA polymerase sigma factor (sigma-70 family)